MQLTQQESPMKGQAVRIGSVRQEEFLWQSTATWEQLWEQKKEQFYQSQATMGRLAQAWVNVGGGLLVFSVYFWHSEGRTARNEALLEAVVRQAKTTRHPWLVACDAYMCPEDCEKSLWFQRELTHVVAPKEASTCRAKDSEREWSERTCHCVIACHSLRERKISQMKVGEDNMSRQHKAVSFVVERDKEIQEWNEQKLPEVLPGYSGGRLPGRNTKERCREEGEVDEGGEERRIRSQIFQEVVAGIQEKVSMHDGVRK